MREKCPGKALSRGATPKKAPTGGLNKEGRKTFAPRVGRKRVILHGKGNGGRKKTVSMN